MTSRTEALERALYRERLARMSSDELLAEAERLIAELPRPEPRKDSKPSRDERKDRFG